MKKIKFYLLALLVVTFASISSAYGLTAQEEAQRKQSYAQAKEEYRQYLQELKKLNSQYQEITGEIVKVMKEEGMPGWEESDAIQEISESEDVDQEGVSIKESEKEMIVSIDMPGIKKDSAQINIADTQILKVAARRKDDETRFIQKTIKLPAAADKTGASAKYEDGVLIVKIYKSKEEANIPILIQ